MERDDVGDKKLQPFNHSIPLLPVLLLLQAAHSGASAHFPWNLVSPPSTTFSTNNERRSEKFPRVGIIQLADKIQLQKTGGSEASWLESGGAS